MSNQLTYGHWTLFAMKSPNSTGQNKKTQELNAIDGYRYLLISAWIGSQVITDGNRCSTTFSKGGNGEIIFSRSGPFLVESFPIDSSDGANGNSNDLFIYVN